MTKPFLLEVLTVKRGKKGSIISSKMEWVHFILLCSLELHLSFYVWWVSAYKSALPSFRTAVKNWKHCPGFGCASLSLPFSVSPTAAAGQAAGIRQMWASLLL